MKKISLKTFRKFFNLNKSKEETDFMVIQQPSLGSDLGKDDSWFGSCYGEDKASCDITNEDEKGGKGRSKSESLTAHRPGALPQDTFPSSAAPLVCKDERAQRHISSTSLRSHHYSPTPWPLRPTNAEETCIKTEVRVKAVVHSSSPSPARNGVRKDFHDLQADTVCQEHSNSLKNSESQNGDLHLHLDEHVPVVIGPTAQDYIQYTVPLREGMYPLEGPRTMVWTVLLPRKCLWSLRGGGSSFAEDENQVEQVPVVAPDIFVDQAVNGLMIGTTGVTLESPRANQSNPKDLSGLTRTDAHMAESMLCHLNFDPKSAPGLARVYDSMQSSGPMVVTSLTEELKKLVKQGWYWGPIRRWEVEGKLANVLDGSFLIPESTDDPYLLSVSFRSHGKTLHTRIEHSNARFSFYEQSDVKTRMSIVDLFFK
ncbi:unnamed protein product [Nyctereutes procyonoides]|uniref:(raccoon dog) hypothetical protein n=1 Tax=Nyctereutes procyonoides TaxID=34880 RepID=A0A811YTK2_NYCPR|nr:unnamed protein product [Nyctereutes procyonoides]